MERVRNLGRRCNIIRKRRQCFQALAASTGSESLYAFSLVFFSARDFLGDCSRSCFGLSVREVFHQGRRAHLATTQSVGRPFGRKQDSRLISTM